MPVEDFYSARKKRYDGFYIPDHQDECCILGQRRPHRGDVYQELWDRWQMPDACRAGDEAAAIAQAITIDTRTLKQRFLDLAQQWEDETGHLSSPSQRMLHPSYKAILGMGHEHKDQIIGFLIQDMKKNRRQWFWALSYLAQANPIKPEDAGRIDRMIDAWVRWERARPRL